MNNKQVPNAYQVYDLKIEKKPNCKRISQYVLNFCFSFDHFDSIKCEKYQEMLSKKCNKNDKIIKMIKKYFLYDC